MKRILFAFALAVLLSLLACPLAAAPEKVRVAELSPQAEAAIDRGLAYLARTQKRDGSWDEQNPVGVTGLCLMAFMVKGHFPDQGPYGDNLARAVAYLLESARAGKGYIGKSMYDHGLATLALSEVWGESSRSDEVRDALKQAVGVIVKSQTPAGGWRYQPNGIDQDVSVTVLQLVALASAREAGILAPEATIKRGIAYVKSCQRPDGRFGYRTAYDGFGPSLSRTAAGVVSLQMCGQRDSKEVRKGLDHLRSLGAAPFDVKYPWFYYGQYYAVVAHYQAGEKDYQYWYPRVRDALVAAQLKDGSWPGGRLPPNVRLIVKTDEDVYCTPMAILVLGVPYRFLPIYQR